MSARAETEFATDGHYDVLVVGGGPAGATTAALLAERGFRVIVVDKDRHPRFHIGESLLPHNLPLFDRFGIREAGRAQFDAKIRYRIRLPLSRQKRHL